MAKITKEAVKKEIDEMTSKEGDFQDVTKGRPRKVKDQIVRTNIDAPVGLLSELDRVASSLNISRQALIKTWLLDGLNNHYQSQFARIQLLERKSINEG